MPDKQKTHCIVIYDVECDKRRNRISCACKDFGLERIQYSVFWGALTKAGRKELFHILSDELDVSPGSILVMPVSEQSFRRMLIVQNEKTEDPEEEKHDGEKKKRRKPEIKTPGEPIPTILRFDND
ncbi:MAG TPA: CRISPR-associated endonuclease Cas2 [bacterium]|nr:CRISPR-associated endonuclease Cas2 [bacterium]